jgi:hypothetical protein
MVMSEAGTSFLARPFREMVLSGQCGPLLDGRVSVPREFFAELLSPMLSRIRFDVAFYRRTYVDLAQAEARGIIADLRTHYMQFGFFENRLPCFVEVDGAFYAREYPDVAGAIVENRTPSAQAHFDLIGFSEGRLPRRGWKFADLMAG